MQVTLSGIVGKGLLALTAVALSIGVGACGDDEVVAPPPSGSSQILVMHANPGFTSTKVNFKNDTATLASLNFGEFAASVLANGSRTVKMYATDGSSLGEVSFSLDSSTSQMAIFSGSTGAKEAIKISSPKIALTGGNAAVRLVHASSNAGDVVVRLNSQSGLPFTSTNLIYKNATPYQSLPVSTTDSLIVFKTDGTTRLLAIPTKTDLAALKMYTIVIYGSTDPNADPSVRLAAKVIREN